MFKLKVKSTQIWVLKRAQIYISQILIIISKLIHINCYSNTNSVHRLIREILGVHHILVVRIGVIVQILILLVIGLLIGLWDMWDSHRVWNLEVRHLLVSQFGGASVLGNLIHRHLWLLRGLLPHLIHLRTLVVVVSFFHHVNNLFVHLVIEGSLQLIDKTCFLFICHNELSGIVREIKLILRDVEDGVK